VDFVVASDDFLVMRVVAVANDEVAVDGDVADGGAIEAEDDEGEKIFRGVPGDGNVAAIDGEEVGTGVGGEVASGDGEGARSVDGG